MRNSFVLKSFVLNVTVFAILLPNININTLMKTKINCIIMQTNKMCLYNILRKKLAKVDLNLNHKNLLC